MEDVI